jgi:hypothetical protein
MADSSGPDRGNPPPPATPRSGIVIELHVFFALQCGVYHFIMDKPAKMSNLRLPARSCPAF